MGKPKVECKKLDVLTDTQKCVFCQKRDIDEMKYGPIYNFKNIITHYYCLLLSSNMEQNGRDCDGILGFLPDDITKEVRRGMRLYCSFCKVGGATLGCSIAKCKVVFHLPCGMKHGTLHQFYGEFKSYCAKHRPVQVISEKILAESGKGAMCGICYEKVVPRPIHETLWAPCCQKSAFFHRECVQTLAISAGYFFKCPLCNNQDKFQKEMKNYGIYIPEQDASWECVPQAYQDLLVRHDSCDSAKCICPSGRKTSVQGTRWELILCKFCGSQGIHIGCGRLKWKCPEFECDICSSNSNAEVEDRNSRNYNGNRHRLSGSNRTAPETHPSVSADREREESGDSSDDSGNITISNMRRKVTTTPRSERHEARQRSPQSEERSSHKKTDSEARDHTKKMRSILIEDSDDDIELVSETKLGDCLKTNDGSMIPVVHMDRGSVQKRPRISGDVSVVPDEIVDCTIQMDGPSKKKDDEPVMEVLYSLPTPQPPPPPQPQPSTSAAYSAPSTSYPPSSDVSQFVLVDPSTLRPEDLPPGTVLLRSVQPMPSLLPQVPPPQMPQPMPPQHPTTSTSVPMSQLGDAGHANAKHPDICKYWPRSCYYYSSNARKKSSKKASREVKCDSSRRRGRRPGHTGCNHDRLKPIVQVEPLKFRTTSNGHIEIVIPKEENLREYVEYRLKSRRIKLPSFPARKIKLTASSRNPSNTNNKKKKSIKVKMFSETTCKSEKKSKNVTSSSKNGKHPKAETATNTSESINSSNAALQVKSKTSKHKHNKESLTIDSINDLANELKKHNSTPDIASFFNSVSLKFKVIEADKMTFHNSMENESKKKLEKRRKNTSESSPEENAQYKKKKKPVFDCKSKKIDYFFKKCNDKPIQIDDNKHSKIESEGLDAVADTENDATPNSRCPANLTAPDVPGDATVSSSSPPDNFDDTDNTLLSHVDQALNAGKKDTVMDTSADSIEKHNSEAILETTEQFVQEKSDDSAKTSFTSEFSLQLSPSTADENSDQHTSLSSSSGDINLTSNNSVQVIVAVDKDEGNYESVIVRSPSSKELRSSDDNLVNQINGFFPKIKIQSKNKNKICKIKEKKLHKVKDIKLKEVKVKKRKAKEIMEKNVNIIPKKMRVHPRESVIKYANISQYFVAVQKDSDFTKNPTSEYVLSDDNSKKVIMDEESSKASVYDFTDFDENSVIIDANKTYSPKKRPLAEVQVNNLREVPCAEF